MVNLSDIFRSVFGLPKERLGPHDLPRYIEEDFRNLSGERYDLPWQQQPLTDVEEWTVMLGTPEHRNKHSDDVYHLSQGNFLQEFEQLFQNFFRGFPFEFNHPIQGPLTTDPPPDMDLPSEMPNPNHPESLRDKMLKQPESDNFEEQHEDNQSEGISLFAPFSIFGGLWRGPFGGNMRNPDEQIDRDLDSEVEKGTQSLDDILQHKDKRQMLQHTPRSSSSSSSFSSVTVVDSNGVTEQRTTRRDSSGKEEVTITRKIGDQTHTITRKKDECGNEETREDLVNINDGDLEKFSEKWHSKRQGKYPRMSDGGSSFPQHTPLSSIYESVLEHFFPRK